MAYQCGETKTIPSVHFVVFHAVVTDSFFIYFYLTYDADIIIDEQNKSSIKNDEVSISTQFLQFSCVAYGKFLHFAKKTINNDLINTAVDNQKCLWNLVHWHKNSFEDYRNILKMIYCFPNVVIMSLSQNFNLHFKITWNVGTDFTLRFKKLIAIFKGICNYKQKSQ